MLWRLTGPLRRPLVRRFHQRMTAAALEAMQSCPAWSQPPAHDRMLSAEMDLLLESVVRELVRLQMQVELLHEMVRESACSAPGDASIARTENSLTPRSESARRMQMPEAVVNPRPTS
jgi:hypothetical protein